MLMSVWIDAIYIIIFVLMEYLKYLFIFIQSVDSTSNVPARRYRAVACDLPRPLNR